MKKLLCALLALVACCVLFVAVSAETTVPTTCEACGGIEVEWKPIPSTWYTLDEGHYHYYLTEKTTKYRYTPNPSGTASSTNSTKPVTICLDLNGFGYETDGRAMGVYPGCTLNIMDSSPEKTGYVKGRSGNNATVGGTFFAYGTLNTYDVLLQYENDGTGTNQPYAGGVVAVGSQKYPDAVFNMYGGRLEGGAMVSHTYTKGATICAEYGTINLYGGDVISGSVPEGKVAPCIYIGNSVQLTLSGDTNVDNIYVNGSKAKVNISGTYSGRARLTCSATPTEGKIIGTGSNTPNLTGELFCTNGNGWIIAQDGTNLKMSAYAPCGEWHYCEHCKDIRRWTDYNTNNFMTPNTTVGNYHYYLSENRTGGVKYPQLKNGSVVCLDMYGNNLICTGRALLVNSGCTLSVMDTKGGGFIAGGPGTNNPRGATATVSGTATLNMYSGTLKYIPGSGDAKSGMLAIGGVLNLYGGKIEGADMSNQSASVGGAVYLYASSGTSGVLNAYGGEITSGKVGSGKGACVYAYDENGSVNLSGDAMVENIYFPVNNKKLTVTGDYTGTTSVTFKTAPALGAEVGVAAENARILGTLSLTNGDRMIQVDGTKLITAISAPVVIVDGENETSFDTLQQAIDACESGYVKLLKPVDETVTVSKDVTIDLNGYDLTGAVTVAEGATLYGKDRETDDYAVSDGVYGRLAAAGKVEAAEGYMAISEDGKVSFHRYEVSITDMTLRSADAGLYYKSTFLGDEKVAEAVEYFGVALSVYEIPTAGNLATACASSVFENFEAGAAGNASASTLLKGILKTENSDGKNVRNMGMQIYGRPYIKTADGYVFGQVQSRNLAQQLESVDTIFQDLTATQRYAIMGLYETYSDILSGLNMSNAAQELARTEDTLSILMVGNSFCYYYVEELYGLLMANPDPNRGYDNVEIYNLYYSGCRLDHHYNWWIAGEANYELYKTNENGRKKQTPATGSAWTLEDTLMQSNWDYISLQGMSTEVSYANGTVEDNIAKMSPYVTPLLGRFYELFPNAQLLWHRTWPFEVGRISGSTIYDEELNAAYDAGMQLVCDYMCDVFDQDKLYDLKIVNSGAAWPIAREANALLETSLLPAGGLCARKGIQNASTYVGAQNGEKNVGDGYHDGDIGGGQFLNACVWYETITGQSCLDNTYQPTLENGNYALSDALVELLRNAAHAALNP